MTKLARDGRKAWRSIQSSLSLENVHPPAAVATKCALDSQDGAGATRPSLPEAEPRTVARATFTFAGLIFEGIVSASIIRFATHEEKEIRSVAAILGHATCDRS